jgi:hypothetical protein
MVAHLSAVHAHPAVLAAFRWNPTVRGILFPFIMFVFLSGSSYMIMATNVGNRLGFLIASACFFGWLTLMAGAWMIYGIGLKGRQPHWVMQEALTGNALRDAQQGKARSLADGYQPNNDSGLRIVKEGTPQRGDAQAVVDSFVSNDPALKATLLDATYYQPEVNAYEWGYEPLFKIPFTEHKVTIGGGRAHYFLIQVRPVQKKKVLDPLVPGGSCEPAAAAAEKDVAKAKKLAENCIDENVKDAKGAALVDTTKPVLSFVMLRDRGSLRQPPFMIFLFSGILTGIIVSVLHRRDKQVMAAMASLKNA